MPVLFIFMALVAWGTSGLIAFRKRTFLKIRYRLLSSDALGTRKKSVIALWCFSIYDMAPPRAELGSIFLSSSFAFRFCNTYRANEKGHIERNVEYVRRKVFSKKDNFGSLDAAKLYLKDELKILNLKPQVRHLFIFLNYFYTINFMLSC